MYLNVANHGLASEECSVFKRRSCQRLCQGFVYGIGYLLYLDSVDPLMIEIRQQNSHCLYETVKFDTFYVISAGRLVCNFKVSTSRTANQQG